MTVRQLFSPKNNVLYTRYVEESKAPTLRTTIIASIGLALLLVILGAVAFALLVPFNRNLAGSVLDLFIGHDYRSPLFQIFPGLMLALASSLVAPQVWKQLTEVEHEESQTLYPANELILITFFRLRVLIALLLITIPFFLLSTSTINLLFALVTRDLPYTGFSWRLILNTFLLWALPLSRLFQQIGFSIMGALLGTILAIKIHKAWLSPVLALASTALLWAVYRVLLCAGNRMFAGANQASDFVLIYVCGIGLLWFMPYVVAWISVNLGQKWTSKSG